MNDLKIWNFNRIFFSEFAHLSDVPYAADPKLTLTFNTCTSKKRLMLKNEISNA